MKTQFGGYDLSYQLDSTALLEVLQSRIVAGVAERLQTLQFSVPLSSSLPSLVQFGTLQTIGAPAATLTLPAVDDAGSATLAITFESVLLSLQAVPGAGSLLPGFGGLSAYPPTSIGAMTLSANIVFTSSTTTTGALVELGLAASLPPGTPAGSLQPVTTVTVPDLSSLGNVSALELQSSLSTIVEHAIAAAVTQATSPIYAIPFPMTFAPPNTCGIGVRSLAVKFLAESPSTQASLGFFMTLLEDSTGDPSAATVSSVGMSGDFALAISNALLKSVVCCAFQNSTTITGLGAETSEDEYSCTWSDVTNVRVGSQTVTVNELKISVAASGTNSSFTFFLQIEQSGWGWQAYGSINVDASPTFENGALQTGIAVATHTWSDVSWWVWVVAGVAIIAGILLLLTGVLSAGGAAILAGAGLAISAILYGLLKLVGWVASEAIGDATSAVQGLGIGLVPLELPLDFGGPADLTGLVSDDLIITAAYAPPASINQVCAGNDVVLGFGDRIDLDRGVVQRGTQSLPGFALEGDLYWEALPPLLSLGIAGATSHPTATERTSIVVNGGQVTGAYYRTQLSTLGSARLVPLGGESFFSITENALATLAFPSTASTVDGSNFAVSQTDYPPGAYVFAVLTSERHLAKCVAWRDASSYLHLSYVTYANPIPLWLASTWTVAQGPLVEVLPFADVYQASWTGTIVARLSGPLAPVWWDPMPVPLAWLWNGTSLASGGTLPGTNAQYAVSAYGMRIVTAMDQALSGVLQVVAQRFGTTFEYTLGVDQPATVRVSTLPNSGGTELEAVAPQPVPDPAVLPPLAAQLGAAFTRGMGLPPGSVQFA